MTDVLRFQSVEAAAVAASGLGIAERAIPQGLSIAGASKVACPLGWRPLFPGMPESGRS
jgi:hypothetical protein